MPFDSIPSIPNHTIDPQTGFTESKAYVYAFDGEKKLTFIKRLVANGLSLYDTCDELGLSHHTIVKHYRNDPAFKDALDLARHEYAERLDGISKKNATNPKSVIERIFQLKSLYPEKYADQKTSGNLQININVDGKSLQLAKEREKIIESELIISTPQLNDKPVDNQSK